MNKRGEMNGLGIFLTVFIVVIVGLSLMTAIAQQVGPVTSTTNARNVTYTAPAANATIDLTGQELLSTPVVTNASSGTVVAAGNYTVAEGISTTSGLKSIQYTSTDGIYQSQPVNISYSYGVDGYITDAGGRAIASLIVLFVALGIAIVAMSPTMRSGLLDLIGK